MFVYGSLDMAGLEVLSTLPVTNVFIGRIVKVGDRRILLCDRDAAEFGHFREMWTRSFTGFLSSAKPGDFICFTPELLGPGAYYARMFTNAAGEKVEESDRWQQALVYCRIARECWAEAQRRTAVK